MSITTIKNHMTRLDKGYRIWAVPLLMLMWDIGFRTGGGNTAADVIKILLTTPYFIMTAAWIIIFSLAMDRRGRLLLSALQNTDDLAAISYIMLEHNRYADLLIATPLVYLMCKGVYMYLTGSVLTAVWQDIHLLMCFIATWDGLKSVRGNVLIRRELNY